MATSADPEPSSAPATGSAIPLLLVTANVGSVFEDPDRLLSTWIDAFVAKVVATRPAFVALHLQEVGGKTYEKSMEYVQDFIRILCETPALQRFSRMRVYLDEDYTSAEHFTALGNLYFVDAELAAVRIWNFLTHEWDTVDDKSIHTGNIESVASKEKAKFPQHFFPECKWSRKGFLRTRWSLSGTVLDLVNIHLFHDASNLAACEEYPSVYCKSRRRALVHTMERFHTDSVNGVAPYFVFGDFNFRCDTAGVVERLAAAEAVAGGGSGAEELTAHRLVNARNDCTKLLYRDAGGKNVLTIGKKEFTHSEHQTKFRESWFHQFNREMEPLADVLAEYPIRFAPSYPYEEEPHLPQHYMTTRCPAWCDRILMSRDAQQLIVRDGSDSGADECDDGSEMYNVIGDAVCMGDHKPVYLNIRLSPQKDLSVRSPSIPASLQAIIDSVLVPPYSSANPHPVPQPVDVTDLPNRITAADVPTTAASAPAAPAAPAVLARSRYIQMPAAPAPPDATADVGGGAEAASAFTYNCSAGMVFRETTV